MDRTLAQVRVAAGGFDAEHPERFLEEVRSIVSHKDAEQLLLLDAVLLAHHVLWGLSLYNTQSKAVQIWAWDRLGGSLTWEQLARELSLCSFASAAQRTMGGDERAALQGLATPVDYAAYGEQGVNGNGAGYAGAQFGAPGVRVAFSQHPPSGGGPGRVHDLDDDTVEDSDADLITEEGMQAHLQRFVARAERVFGGARAEVNGWVVTRSWSSGNARDEGFVLEPGAAQVLKMRAALLELDRFRPWMYLMERELQKLLCSQRPMGTPWSAFEDSAREIIGVFSGHVVEGLAMRGQDAEVRSWAQARRGQKLSWFMLKFELRAWALDCENAKLLAHVEQLAGMRQKPSESVNSYTLQFLQRVADACGGDMPHVAGDDHSRLLFYVLRHQFAASLNDKMLQGQLHKQFHERDCLSWSDLKREVDLIVDTYCITEGSGEGGDVAEGARGERPKAGRTTPSSGTTQGKPKAGAQQIECYFCHGRDHIRRDCPLLAAKQAAAQKNNAGGTTFASAPATSTVQPRNKAAPANTGGGGSGGPPSQQELVCFYCNGKGHKKAHCPRLNTARASGRSGTKPEATPGKVKDVHDGKGDRTDMQGGHAHGQGHGQAEELSKMVCFACKGRGHKKSSCPQVLAKANEAERRQAPVPTTSAAKSGIKCFYCHQPGHKKVDCPGRYQGSGGATSSAADGGEG
jgi:hypothetical protein